MEPAIWADCKRYTDLRVVRCTHCEVRFGTTQVDALSIYEVDDDIPPIIFINMQFPWDRLRYTMIHELAHIILHHHNPDYTLNTDCEKEADQFAAAFCFLPKTLSHT